MKNAQEFFFFFDWIFDIQIYAFLKKKNRSEYPSYLKRHELPRSPDTFRRYVSAGLRAEGKPCHRARKAKQ